MTNKKIYIFVIRMAINKAHTSLSRNIKDIEKKILHMALYSDLN